MGNFKHGKSHTRLYKTYSNIKMRCYNADNSRYRFYGARGIMMCDEWLNDFQAFYDWAMANGYQENLTIDRIDVDGNYEPTNCRWVTRQSQQNNRRDNHLIEFNGQVHTMAEWARIAGINYHTLAQRVNTYGWSVEKALTEKVGDSYHCR